MLKSSELNYSIHAKEFLAVFCATKYFAGLLRHKQFTLFVDNQAVSYLKTLKMSQDTPRETRYVAYLSKFLFDVRTLPMALDPAALYLCVRAFISMGKYILT